MILFDFECTECKHLDEYLIDRDTETLLCPKCGADMKKSFLRSGSHRTPDEAEWIRTVLDVVDKTPGYDKPHTREFLKNPTRENYRKWMKENNLRPADYNGSAYTRPTEAEVKREKDKILHELTLKHRDRQAIRVGRR